MITLIKNIGRIYSADTKSEYGQYQEYKNSAILLEDEFIRHIYPEPDPVNLNADTNYPVQDRFLLLVEALFLNQLIIPPPSLLLR